LINGFFIAPPQKQTASLDEIVNDVKGLGGSSSIQVENQTTGQVVASYNSTKPLPIGSTFKLYVLGTLCDRITKGKSKWTDVVYLDSSKYSLPSGELQKWPHGSPVTLHTLAALMISKSDNTATDALLNYLGKYAVEQFQQVMGNTSYKMNIPFLSTYEMFRLKFGGIRDKANSFAKADSTERRRILKHVVWNVKRSNLNFEAEPFLPDSIEWFSSTQDLCEAMNWFRTNAEAPAVKTAMEIMGINPGTEINTDKWKVVCYKGGSETGVLNLIYLLKHKNGNWFAISASWTKQDSSVETLTLMSAVTRAIQLLE